MTRNQLYKHYQSAVKEAAGITEESMLSNPVLNYDIYEDDHMVLNRLFYALPLPKAVSVYIFFEDNTFLKDSEGELTLTDSSLHVFKK